MSINDGMFSSKTDLWSTPQATFDELNKEFHFTLDPCSTHENAKCEKCAESNTLVVALLPSRTDTKWFHDYIYGKAEIRFIKGRLKFGDSKNSAPFPSMIVIWRNA